MFLFYGKLARIPFHFIFPSPNCQSILKILTDNKNPPKVDLGEQQIYAFSNKKPALMTPILSFLAFNTGAIT
jgi:hypothetical protein